MCAIHLARAFANRKEHLEYAAEQLRMADKDFPFQAIACCGVSGIVFASPLALMLNKHLLVVRKAGDKHHSSLDVETSFPSYYGEDNLDGKQLGYVFVDDLIETGDTAKRVMNRLSKMGQNRGEPKMTYVGRYLYSAHQFTSFTDDTIL